MNKEGIHTSGVSEMVLEVADLAAAEEFYAGVLGFPMVERDEALSGIWVMAGTQTRIGLWNPRVGIAGGRGGAHVHFALRIEDSDFSSTVGRLEAHGLPVHIEHWDDGRGDSAYVTDPDGNVVEFWTWDVAKHLEGHDGS
jgi:catechol 2,3-dioxygenase-like lactoylglutathione lyase family enzyme